MYEDYFIELRAKVKQKTSQMVSSRSSIVFQCVGSAVAHVIACLFFVMALGYKARVLLRKDPYHMPFPIRSVKKKKTWV